jgi:hypothetical protein
MDPAFAHVALDVDLRRFVEEVDDAFERQGSV